jgi:hypothetical protein
MRWLILASVLLIASVAWAQDTNSELVLTLEGFDYGPNGQSFGVQENVPVPGGLDACLPAGSICEDPLIKSTNGGDATDESGPFSFTATGDGDYDFQNVSGTTWSDLEITFSLQGFENSSTPFSCDGGNVYSQCGFVDPDNQIEVYFYDAFTNVGGGITPAVPEPSQWLTLLLGAGLIVIVHNRKRLASSFS